MPFPIARRTPSATRTARSQGFSEGPPTGSIADMWLEAAAIDARCDDLADAMWTRYFALEAAILAGKIQTRADAIAKLELVHVIFEGGHREDEADMAVLADALRWLKAN
jgi:hypothetical protein